MPAPKKDGVSGGGNSGKVDGSRVQNGNRSDFRTDTAISSKRFGNERTLQPWVPDADDHFDGSLEKSANTGHWDQFAENEKRFGVRSNYDESFYTTTIDKSHPQYRERMAAAEKKAREIERSAPVTAHVAEERVMDYVAGNNAAGDENEEDKYSGVRRQDLPSLAAGRENKYTPPAKRAPSGQSSVKGAPVDPAIISSQIRAPPRRESTPAAEQARASSANSNKNGMLPAKLDVAKPVEAKSSDEKAVDSKSSTTSDVKSPSTNVTEKAAVPARSAGTTSRTMSPQAKEGTPSATSTVERDVLKEFKSFATQQRMNAEKVRSSKAKADKEIKLTELKKFASSFKLSTPVPTDLVFIIAKDPERQKEIQAKAMKNAEEVAKVKVDTAGLKEQAATIKETPSKSTEPATPATDPRSSRTPAAVTHQTPSGPPNRHTGPRQQYPQPQYHAQQYRNNRNGPQHIPPQQQTGTLAQRLRNVEQQKFSQPPTGPQYPVGQDVRSPPTGPSNNGGDASFNRRHSGVPGHMGAKLNPNSHEFKPSPFAASFNPNGHVSASSSPRSSVNNVADPGSSGAASGGQLIRRKTKAVDPSKCLILTHIESIKPPQGRNWDDNGGLRPAYDTMPLWRQLQDEEKPDSTMHLTYKQFFERQPFAAPAMTTPSPPHALPHVAHQHQLPFHLQHGAPAMGGPRQSPHVQPMRMDTPQHSHGPHPPYGNDDHRMMHSNSAQSFASPRPGQVPVAYPGVGSPAQMQYNQPVFMGPGTPHMGQFRSFSNNPQYGPPQQGQMGATMMMQPHYMTGPQGMVGGPQMMYPGGHPQFMPQGPPQPMPGVNGYPSPGRPAAPMMVHQGSQQGHPMYGMSPSVHYSQPAYGMNQPGGPMSNMRGYNNAGLQQFGTSPQPEHQYGMQHRSGSNSYNKNYASQGQHPGTPGSHQIPPAAASRSRSNESSADETK